MLRGWAALAGLGGALAFAGAALAGPPYVTDDLKPTRTGGWKNYALVSGANTSEGPAG